MLREQGLEEHVGAVLDALTKKPKQTPGALDKPATERSAKRTQALSSRPSLWTASRDAVAPEPSVTKGVTVTPKVTPLARVD